MFCIFSFCPAYGIPGSGTNPDHSPNRIDQSINRQDQIENCQSVSTGIVVDNEVEEVIKETCIEISKIYVLYFLEIGTDKDHVHFLIQSVPSYSPMQIVKIVKSITAREVFARCPEVKKKLWGGNFWSSGYYVATVSEHGNEDVIANYVKNQGNEYNKIFRNTGMDGQKNLFE